MATINKKIENVYELTPLQEGMLFHYLYDNEFTGYILQYVFKVNAEIDLNCIKEALRLLSKRYSVLRTVIASKGFKKPRQIVLFERELELKTFDVSKKDDKELESKKIISNDLKRGFDFVNDSLLRTTIIKYDEDEYKLVFSIHHIIIDGWCFDVLLNKFFEYYERILDGEHLLKIENEIKKERDSSFDYDEYIKWLGKQNRTEAKDYWSNLLYDYDNICEIKPSGYVKNNKKSIGEVAIEIDSNVTTKLKKLAEECDSTINTIAEVAIGILLQAYGSNRDSVFGKTVSGRSADIRGIDNIVGLFANTIPIRVRYDKNTTIKELIINQQKQGTDSLNYDYYSLAEIQSLTSQGTDLIKVIYVFENYNSGLKEDNKYSDKRIELESYNEQTNYDISISGCENDNKLVFKLLYHEGKYSLDDANFILNKLRIICNEIISCPDKKVSEIEMLTAEEKHLIINDFNATETDYPRDKTVVELFEEQVKKT
ncbi:MAG: non-ribosomal peptide synthetase, partial [Clostridia bacterium]|nr:non-ribosomal peptide synthetase [Clostridia bacterium]